MKQEAREKKKQNRRRGTNKRREYEEGKKIKTIKRK